MKNLFFISVLCSVFVSSASAATLVIDDFSDGFPTVTTQAAQDGAMLGGERDIAMIFSAALTSGNFEVTGGAGILSSVNTDDDGNNYFRLIYDGEDNNGDAFAYGLANVDVTDGGDNDRFVVHLRSVTGTIKVQVRVWSDSGTFSLLEFTDVTSAGVLEFPFADLTPVAGTLDLTSVDQVSVMIGLDDNEAFEIDKIEATNDIGLDTIAPTVDTDGEAKVTISGSKAKLRGAAADNLSLDRVEVQEGSRAYRSATLSGSETMARWSYRSKRLKESRTIFLIRSVDANGNVSAIDRVKVKRR